MSQTTPQSAKAALPPARLQGVAIALLIYTVLMLADAWVALPMRAASTQLAYWGLKALGLPIELQGVIMTTPNLVFEVIPACSGSATLRVLLFLGVIWFSLQPQWSGARRTLGALLAIPLALVANAVRLSWLAGMGHLRGEPLEGLAHEWTGLIAFILGALGIVLLTQAIRPRSTQAPSKRQTTRHTLTIAIAALSLAAFLPFFHWVAIGWRDSPLDRQSWIYPAVGFAGLTLGAFWIRKRAAHLLFPKPVVSWPLALGLLGLLGFYALSLIADVRGAFAGSFGSWLWLIVSLRFRPRATLALAPWIVVICLGSPTVPYILNELLTRVLGMSGSQATGQWAQGALAGTSALLGVIATLRTGRWRRNTISPRPDNATGAVAKGLVFATLAAAIAFRTLYGDSALGAQTEGRLQLSYQLDAWEGRSTPLPRPIDGWEQGVNYWSRTYQQEGVGVIGLLVASSQGNRHNLHPPEYCFTGSGWRIVDTQTIEKPIGANPTPQPVTRIAVERGAESISGLYWYTDGSIVLPDYRSVILEDFKRRLLGENTVWYFFRALSSDPTILEDQFLPQLSGTLSLANESRAF